MVLYNECEWRKGVEMFVAVVGFKAISQYAVCSNGEGYRF
jgi:hypothetical protein